VVFQEYSSCEGGESEICGLTAPDCCAGWQERAADFLEWEICVLLLRMMGIEYRRVPLKCKIFWFSSMTEGMS